MTERGAVARLAAIALVAAGCAKSVFPPGGPLDTAPPRVIAATPADSSVRVPLTAAVEILFSESMDHASVRDATRIRPPVERPEFDWSGRRFRISWPEPLRGNTTYHVVLRGSARDDHGVPLGAPYTIHFATGDTLAPGRITGVLRGRTLPRAGIPILAFPARLGDRPDTTAPFEPTYEAATDTSGVYEMTGIDLNESLRVFAFYDRNSDGAFDGETDLIAPHPAPIRLTPARTVADSINIVAIDPKAPAIVSGAIAARDSTARYQVEARGASDSLITRRVERVGPGAYTLRVPAGSWTLRAIRAPGPAGAPPRLEVRRSDVLELQAEQERTGVDFDFVPVEGAVPPREPPPTPPDGNR